MRKSTMLWLSLAAVCGALLFQTSQQVTNGRSQLDRLQRDVAREEESLRVLQAEWSYLNQPERLEKLSREHLDLQPTGGRQFVRLRDLDKALTGEEISPAPRKTAVTATAEKPKLPEKAPAPKTAPVSSPPKPAAASAPAAKQDFNSLMKNLGVR